jgi:hypothetical protein
MLETRGQNMKIKKILNSSVIFFFLSIIFLLLLTKIDFRFDEINPGSFVDDAEYYYHAQTIAIDYDLDYSNQMPNTPYRNLNSDDPSKVLPVHSIGLGIFAAPFLFISDQISQFVNFNSPISLNYYIYSLTPIVYLFLSVILIEKTLFLNNLSYKKNILYLVILGSGVSYFAFERFSMSHIYEFFATAVLLYLMTIHEKTSPSNKKKLEFFIPVFMFLALTIRWSNYFYFLIPLFYSKFILNKKIYLYRKPLFLGGALLGLALFLMHTKYLYGIYTINPSDIFFQVEDRYEPDYYRFFDATRIFENILYIFKSFLIINFSQEFGLLYFSPVLFIGFFSIFHNLFKRNIFSILLIILIYLFPFFSTLVLNNPGYSYGYRYLYSTIPLFTLLFFKDYYRINVVRRYMIFGSSFALISQLLFETTQYTVLSADYTTNTFGLYTKYVNPLYLSGVLKSLFIVDAYLNMIFTSFLGVLVIKIISFFTDPAIFVKQFRPLNDDITDLIYNSINFPWSMFFIILILFTMIIKKLDLIKSNH